MRTRVPCAHTPTVGILKCSPCSSLPSVEIATLASRNASQQVFSLFCMLCRCLRLRPVGGVEDEIEGR